MDQHRQQLVRDLLAARKEMIAAEQAARVARANYIAIERRYIDEMPSIPGRIPNVFCGDVFIQADYANGTPGERLDFTEGERCPTSE